MFITHRTAFPYTRPGGRVFHVNTNIASEARNAGAPWFDVDGVDCFNTMQGAIDACVAERGDVIFVAADYQEPAATVNFNKDGITVIGQTMGSGPGELRCVIDGQATTGPAITITKRCHLVDLEFCSKNATAIFGTEHIVCAALIDNEAAATDGQGTWFDNCTFKNQNRSPITHLLFNKGAPQVRVTDCRFYGNVTYAPTAGLGSSPSGAAPGLGRPGEIHIEGNYFEDCTYMYDAIGATRRSVFKGNYGGYSRPDAAWVKGLLWAVTHTVGTNATRVIDNYFPGTYDTAHSHTRDLMESYGCLFSGNKYEGDLPGDFNGT